MPVYVLSSPNSTEPSTVAGDTIILMAGAAVTAGGSAALQPADDVNLILDGTLYGSRGFTSNNGGDIVVGRTGHITAFNIHAGGIYGGGTLTNHGLIEGFNTAPGLDLRSSTLNPTYTTTIFNDGSISSTTNIAILGSATATSSISLVNSGSIFSGSNVAYDVSSTIDRIVNTGEIYGSVRMNAGSDFFDGRGGRTIGNIEGGDGNDTIYGGVGADNLFGNNNDDTLYFSIEDSVVNGGTGVDAAYNTYNDFGLTFNMGANSIEQYYGSQAGETIVTSANIRMDVDAGGGNDLISGGAQGDGLSGGTGNDTIFGGLGPDQIGGGFGDDRIIGGIGADLIYGEQGNDTFVYNGVGDAGDTITDFEIGRDKIEILRSGFDFSLGTGTLAANRLVAGPANQAFGQFLLDTSTGNVFWDGDGTGAGTPTFLFQTQGVGGLNNADFFVV
jgi:Ca2+-binding RTX toxin-like protein